MTSAPNNTPTSSSSLPSAPVSLSSGAPHLSLFPRLKSPMEARAVTAAFFDLLDLIPGVDFQSLPIAKGAADTRLVQLIHTGAVRTADAVVDVASEDLARRVNMLEAILVMGLARGVSTLIEEGLAVGILDDAVPSVPGAIVDLCIRRIVGVMVLPAEGVSAERVNQRFAELCPHQGPGNAG